MKPYFTRLYVCLCLAASAGLSLNAQEKKFWIPVDDAAPAGSPVILNVLIANSEETEVEVIVPGLWAEQVAYADRQFLRLSYPTIEFRGKGFPAKRGDPGWWDFPAEMKQPRRNPASFIMGDGSVRPLLFPQSAVGSKPTTEEEMKRLGIDPEGAKPGLPRLRPLVSMSRKNSPETLEARIVPGEARTITLQLPVVPAGFEGGDAELEGYSAPELVEENFYRSFKGEYVGSEPLLGDVAGMGGAFAGAPLSISAITLTEPARIKVMPAFRVYLKHLAGAEDFNCPLPWDHWIFTFPFINGAAIRESLTAKGLKIEASRSARYLILCPKDWRPTLETFALWKQAKGLNVDFVYVGTGGDLPANRNDIDTYLENYFKQHYCHGVYVLICGDQNIIPAGRSSLITGSPDGASADSDHVYEVLGNDKFPSLYVGRLSADDTTELKNQLDKILKYERTPVRGDWPTLATLCANSQMDNGDYGVNSEWPTKYSLAVQQTVTYGSYTNPPTFETLHAGAANTSVVRAVNQDILDALDEGRGQLLYRGHGDENSWVSGWDGSGSSSSSGSAFTAMTHVNNLKNTVQPIVYAINCLNSRINRSDCIAERWMSLADAGAVAHFGATVTSYTSENHERTKGIFKAIYERGHTRLGPMLAAAEAISHAATGGGASWDSNTFCYMLLGDPEMEIRRKAVPKIIGPLTGVLVPLGKLLKVRVVDEKGNGQPGAFVNLIGSDGRRFNGFANTDGEVEFPIDPSLVARLDLLSDGFPYTAEYLQAPALEAVGFVAGGFKIRLKQAPQGVFRIYGSSNLQNWQNLGLATPIGVDQEFVDPAAPTGGGAKRFYKAVQEP
jgi:hypothetical protein